MDYPPPAWSCLCCRRQPPCHHSCSRWRRPRLRRRWLCHRQRSPPAPVTRRSEEHTSELLPSTTLFRSVFVVGASRRAITRAAGGGGRAYADAGCVTGNDHRRRQLHADRKSTRLNSFPPRRSSDLSLLSAPAAVPSLVQQVTEAAPTPTLAVSPATITAGASYTQIGRAHV